MMKSLNLLATASLLWICNVLPTFGIDDFVIPLFQPGATFSQPGFGPEQASDGLVESGNGWAVSPETEQTQRIWWETDGMILGTGAGGDLSATLSFRGINGNPNTFLMRRFRLAFTTDSDVSSKSLWQPVILDSVSATGGVGISGSGPLTDGWIEISGSFSTACDYEMFGYVLNLNGPITGISIEVEPANGALGTSPNGNFILTEFSVRLPVWNRLIVSEEIGIVHAPGNLIADQGSALVPDDMSAPNGNMVTIVDDGILEPTEHQGYYILYPDSSLGIFHIYIVDNDGPSQGFEAYVENYGLHGPPADFDWDADGDTLPNGIEYLFHLNPNGPDSALALQRLPHVAPSSTAGTMALVFDLPNPKPLDVKVVLREGNLTQPFASFAERSGFGLASSWTGSGSSRIEENHAPSLTSIEAKAPGPTATNPQHFFQFHAERIVLGGSE